MERLSLVLLWLAVIEVWAIILSMQKYKGTIVMESLIDDRQLNDWEIVKFCVSRDENPVDRWHLFTVLMSRKEIVKLADNLKPAWYAHFYLGDEVVAVFAGKLFEFKHSDHSTWIEAVEYGKSLGIAEEQLDFPVEE